MNARQIVYQRPCPKIIIKDPETGKTVKSKNSGAELEFVAGKNTNLLSYSFTLSINDISGSFSATFYPDYNDGKGNTFSLFDDFEKLQIVEIYEGNGTSLEKPVFCGIIRSKKYVAQTNDSGGHRRISITGTAITGLVSQFYINLDVAACALTGQLKEQAQLITSLTMDGTQNKNVSDVIKKIWDCFYEISKQIGTPKIKEYINKYTGDTGDTIDNFFKFDNSKFAYPLGCVFKGQQTQDFFSIVEEIIPSPVYEKFSFMDKDGKMKIKIRLVPFSSSNWKALEHTPIPATVLQSFDLTESDNEVYTAFYAYLNSYPIDEQKSLILSTMKDSGVDSVLKDSDAFKTYGYRPMIAHFIGYGMKDGETDSQTPSDMEDMSKNLKEWYENLPDMLKGSATLSMVFDGNNATNKIQPGEVVQFLEGEFYVEGVTHSWNYGQGGEVNLSVSRGGKYLDSGKFKGKIENLTSLVSLLQKGQDSNKSLLTLRR